MRPALPRHNQHPAPELLERPKRTQQTVRDVRHVHNNPYTDVCTIDCNMFLARRATEDLVVRRTSEHIVSHLGDDLSTGTLARLVGVSERHLSRLFHTHVQETPAQYVRRVRTEAAEHLLVSTELPTAAVARRCGFGSTESLRQAFLNRYAVPPSRYRRQHTPAPGSG
jgi:transcriptional regulator GlxA family with amidase domain